MNAPSTFQQTMNGVSKNIGFAQVYLDDVVVYSKNMNERMAYLQKVFAVIKGQKLKFKMSKCVSP